MAKTFPLTWKKSCALWLSTHTNQKHTNEEVAAVVMCRYQEIFHLIEPNTWLFNRGHQLNQLETAQAGMWKQGWIRNKWILALATNVWKMKLN